MCDEMLLRLGRWLRAAGYDTAIAAGGTEDAALIARCAAEGRVLLTRDRLLAARAEASVPVLLLVEDRIDDQARALAATLGTDWLRAPFTRCVIDNAELEPAPPEAAAQMPTRSREAGGPLLRCPVCRRLYWPGGHVRRMRERLAVWAGNGRCKRVALRFRHRQADGKAGGCRWPSSGC
jgi:uncharacterized protein with PIN domain